MQEPPPRFTRHGPSSLLMFVRLWWFQQRHCPLWRWRTSYLAVWFDLIWFSWPMSSGEHVFDVLPSFRISFPYVCSIQVNNVSDCLVTKPGDQYPTPLVDSATHRGRTCVMYRTGAHKFMPWHWNYVVAQTQRHMFRDRSSSNSFPNQIHMFCFVYGSSYLRYFFHRIYSDYIVSPPPTFSDHLHLPTHSNPCYFSPSFCL